MKQGEELARSEDGRYRLQRSTFNPKFRVLTDVQEQVVITFESGHFNDSQRVTFLNDYAKPSPLALARVLRLMGDALVAMCPEEREREATSAERRKLEDCKYQGYHWRQSGGRCEGCRWYYYCQR